MKLKNQSTNSKSYLSREGILFSLIGVAGSGKTTLVKKLLNSYDNQNNAVASFERNLNLSISVTTRDPRPNETHGVEYYFVTKTEFQQKIDAGDFFEWEEIHGRYYGTLKETINSTVMNSALKNSKLKNNTIEKTTDLLFDIDIKGALNIKKSYPRNSVNIFILPPSYEEMVKRLKLRGDSEDEIKKRTNTAIKEYEIYLKSLDLIDYTIINDELEDSFEKLLYIIQAESLKSGRFSKNDLIKYCFIPPIL